MTIPDYFMADHKVLRTLTDELRGQLKAGEPIALSTALKKLQEHVREHFRREDIFYRVLDNDKRVEDRGMMHQIRNDHAAIIFGLESLAIRLRKYGFNTDWQTRLNNLLNILIPHCDQEEANIFPDAMKLLTPAEIQIIQNELGRSA